MDVVEGPNLKRLCFKISLIPYAEVGGHKRILGIR